MRAALIRAGQVALTFALFSVFNALAFHFEIEPGVSILFPATAIAILACMAFGWWAAIGVALATIATPWGANADFMTLTISGLVSVVEGMIPYFVFRWRRNLSSDLRDLRSLIAFLIFGCVVNTAFSAIAGNLLIIPHPPGVHLVWREVFVWWIADFTAALLLATPALAFGNALFSRIRNTDRTLSDQAGQPRTIANALQILTIIVLLGFAASFAIRVSLLNQLEADRLDQQRSWGRSAEIVNRMHENFFRIAGVDRNDPAQRAKIETARRMTDQDFAQLQPVITHASPALAAEMPRIVDSMRSWFAGATTGENTTQSIGRRFMKLRSDMDSANAKAWAEFAEKRGRMMFVVGLVDVFVFFILVLASATLMLNISRPFAQMRLAINAMRDGQPADPARIESGYLEFRSIADALTETHTELRKREAELRLQTERAIAASQHKSDFLAKMSHELRTPLNSIIGFSDLLAEQEETIDHARRIAFLENVSTSARHLLGLINDLLDVSKIESGKMKMHFENIDLRQSINNTVRSISPLFVRKRQQVIVTIPDEPMMAVADPSRVEQVLLNLLSNANKYSPEGKKISIVSALNDRDWRIEVRDHGIGINNDDQIRIFEDFEQVYTRGPNSSGTGLGLALVKRFVEMHGGRVEVESRVGEGSTFAVSFPRL